MADTKDLNAKQSVVYNDNRISLYQPESSTSRNNVYTRPGDIINLNFDIKSVRVEIINGDVHIVFANGSTMSLISLASIGFSSDAPAMRDLQGNLLSLDEFLNKAYVLNYNQAYLILTNKDNYQLSEEQPNLVSTASDNQTTFDGGTPVSGVGNIDVLTRGQPTQVFQTGAVDASGSLRGTGEYAITSFKSNSPFSSSSSNILPGTKVIEPKPNLTYSVLYGTDLTSKGPISLVNSKGDVRFFGSSYQLSFLDSTAVDNQDVLLNSIVFPSSLATSNDNLFINNTSEFMEYIFDLNYAKGVFPTGIDIILQGAEKNANLSVIPYGNGTVNTSGVLSSFGGGLTGYGYSLGALDSSGNSKFILRLPYATQDRAFDITYMLTYIDPNTSTSKAVFFTQPVTIKAVSSEKDLLDSKYVLSSGAPGINVNTGSGNDIILGGVGPNKINAGSGDDMVFSGPSSDFIILGPGDDKYWGSIGFDFVDGVSGMNTVYYNNQRIDLDSSKTSFKDSFFDTYKPTGKLTISLGLGVAVKDLLYGAKKDEYSALLNSSSIFVNQGGLYFDVLNNINTIYGVDLVEDFVEISSGCNHIPHS